MPKDSNQQHFMAIFLDRVVILVFLGFFQGYKSGQQNIKKTQKCDTYAYYNGTKHLKEEQAKYLAFINKRAASFGRHAF